MTREREISGVVAKEEDACAILGIAPEADAEEARRAYIEKVRQFPPDRAPEAFERIRDAYEQVRDPKRRARRLLEGPHPLDPLVNLVDAQPVKRRHVDPALWLAVLREK